MREVFLADYTGLIGSAILRCVQTGQSEILARSHAELDLTDQADVHVFLQEARHDVVILAAAKVGGIHANKICLAEFIYENLAIEVNVIREGFKAGITCLLFLGSSCVYPHAEPQAMAEEALATGILEAKFEPSAIAGTKRCESYNRQYGTDYRSMMPTNLYGPGDTSIRKTVTPSQRLLAASTVPSRPVQRRS